MKDSSPKASFSLFRLVCSTFGHDYIITRKVTNHINEYKCSHCGREVTDGPAGKLEDLTNKIKQVNTCVATFFQKRTQRISA
jgi:DNA-directed RNA polymerase subunit RPC12/RpoP